MYKDWTEVEMVLTLAFYLLEENSQSKKKTVVFSEMVNRITGLDRSSGSFRMRVGNFVSVNPNSTQKGFYGGGKRVFEIWEKYVTYDPNLVELKKIYSSFLEQSETLLERNDFEDYDYNNDKLRRTVTAVNVFNRSSKVKNNTLKRADGICELCLEEAPFIDRNNKPYLEVHHIVHLSKDGLDSTDNTLALCPNCHMKLHHGKELTKSEQKIINDILTK